MIELFGILVGSSLRRLSVMTKVRLQNTLYEKHYSVKDAQLLKDFLTLGDHVFLNTF